MDRGHPRRRFARIPARSLLFTTGTDAGGPQAGMPAFQ
jgi:hypothetical protein